MKKAAEEKGSFLSDLSKFIIKNKTKQFAVVLKSGKEILITCEDIQIDYENYNIRNIKIIGNYKKYWFNDNSIDCIYET